MPTADKALIDRLPQDERDEFVAIGREAMSRFAFAYQRVFDTHLAFFEVLVGKGATAAHIGKMLAEVGIKRGDGTALPLGTVSSAMSRARERRAAQRAQDPGLGPANPGVDLQVAAGRDNAVHAPADRFTTTGAIAVDAMAADPSNPPPQNSRFRTSPNPPALKLPTATRNAADRLDQIRSNHADQHDD